MHSRITKKYLTSGYKHTLNYEHPNNKKNSANTKKRKKQEKTNHIAQSTIQPTYENENWQIILKYFR